MPAGDQIDCYLSYNVRINKGELKKKKNCLFLPRTSDIKYNQLAELVATFIYSEC